MLKLLRRLAGPAALLFALAGSGQAAAASGNQADIAHAEAYLNAVTTLKAHFLQVGPSGDTSEGTVYLWRPGRLRLDYDPPSPIQVVTEGSFLVYYDKKLGQVSYIGINSTPAGVLVAPSVKLNGKDLVVTKVGHQPGILTLTVTRRADPAQGYITLVFQKEPFALKQWQVVDAQGQVTQVSLYNVQRDIKLDKSLFTFVNPNFAPPDYSKTDPTRDAH